MGSDKNELIKIIDEILIELDTVGVGGKISYEVKELMLEMPKLMEE
jgi:hypothetical protein